MMQDHASSSSNLFTLIETLGVVSDGVPPSIYCLGSEAFIATSLKRSYYVMNVNKLRLVFRSPILPCTISAIYGVNENIYLGYQETCEISLFHRTSCLGSLKGHQYPVKGMFSLDVYLISWSEYEVIVFDLSDRSLHGFLKRPDQDQRKISCVLHPDTYVNKILVCYRSTPEVELWNIHSLKLIHLFRCVQEHCGDACGVTAVSSTPHPDIVALGTAQGHVLLMNLTKDTLLGEVRHEKENGAVTALTCRPEITQEGIMMSGCQDGSLTVWNLAEEQCVHVLHQAHEANPGVTYLGCLAHEPLMISSGHDNSLVVWIFDSPGHLPRPLRSRRGLTKPLCFLQFYDEQAKHLLCVAQDHTTQPRQCTVATLAAFQQHQNVLFTHTKSLSAITQTWRKPLHHLPGCTSMAFCPSRHYDWPNIVTTHTHLSSVFLWSGHNKTLAPRTIDLPRELRKNKDKSLVPTAVALSPCGQYVIVGYNEGSLHKFNLQSGLYRKEFLFQNRPAHENEITQVQVLSYSTVVSISKQECCLRRWSLHTCQWLNDLDLRPYLPLSPNSAHVLLFKTFELLVCVLLETQQEQDTLLEHTPCQTLVILDSETGTLIRQLNVVPQDQVLALALSQDARWLLYSTKKHPHLYVYDILSSALIDWIQFDSPITCMTFDPSNTLLYLALESLNGGLLVLANQHIFHLPHTDPLLKPPPTAPLLMASSASHPLESPPTLSTSHLAKPEPKFFSPHTALEPGRLTLSGMSSHRLESILHLDLIKQRNSGSSRVAQKATTLPFFLPTIKKNDTTTLDTPHHHSSHEPHTLEKKTDHPASSIASLHQNTPLQQLLHLFHHTPTETSGEKITQYFLHLSPSAIDLALLHLGAFAGGTDHQYLWLLDYFIHSVYQRQQADFIQLLLAVFLKKHSPTLIDLLQPNPSQTTPQPTDFSHQLNLRLKTLRNLIKQDWEPFDLLCHQTSSFLKLLTHTQLE